MGDEKTVDRKEETGTVAEQSSITERRHSDAGVPRRKVERIENRANENGNRQRTSGPVYRLSHDPAAKDEKWKSKCKAPKSRSDCADIGEAHHPRTKSKRRIAEEQRGKGEGMGIGRVTHAIGLRR